MSIALMFVLSLSVSVVRCVGADGAVSYQDKPCAQGEQASEIVLLDQYHYTPPEPDSERERREPAFDAYDGGPPLREPPREKRSWRCDADNGETFYRHDYCPSTIPAVRLGTRMDGYASQDVVYVHATPVPRSEACAAIAAMAAGERLGSDRDQRASPYDKLTGRDMCR